MWVQVPFILGEAFFVAGVELVFGLVLEDDVEVRELARASLLAVLVPALAPELVTQWLTELTL
jgi:hypothetical protein